MKNKQMIKWAAYAAFFIAITSCNTSKKVSSLSYEESSSEKVESLNSISTKIDTTRSFVSEQMEIVFVLDTSSSVTPLTEAKDFIGVINNISSRVRKVSIKSNLIKEVNLGVSEIEKIDSSRSENNNIVVVSEEKSTERKRFPLTGLIIFIVLLTAIIIYLYAEFWRPNRRWPF